MNPLILALDTDNLDLACKWVEATQASIRTYKTGLEFFLKFGASGIAQLRTAGDFDLFLDLKLHDIPNTVKSAVLSIAHLQPKFLTVHGAGGSQMIEAAAKAAPTIDITAVTVLTSLSQDELPLVGFTGTPTEIAVRIASVAVHSGARAIVSSPQEVEAIRAAIGPVPAIITPGVRPKGSDQGDQKRVMTPAQAIAKGSTYLVIGRPITSLYASAGEGSNGLRAMGTKAAEILEEMYG